MSVEPAPSATLVLLRDGDGDVELLLLRKTPRPDGKERPWVFPGGKVEAADLGERRDDLEGHARRAAVRETEEEAGLTVSAADLITISRWITPEIAPRRFDTWFFLSAVGHDARVRVDGSEICEHRWLPPREALAAHFARELRLAPPTFVTVSWLETYRRSTDAVATLAEEPVLTIRPVIRPIPDGACILYPGDVGYTGGDFERPGPRHRLWSGADDYRYERSG